MTEDIGEPTLGLVTECGRLLAPARLQRRGRRVGLDLRDAGAIGGDLEQAGAFVGAERSPELGGALGDESGAEVLHLLAPSRPRIGESSRHADDLGDAVVVHGGPGDTETHRQLGTQRGLVEHAGGLLVLVELARVERQPATICGADLVGDEQVAVQLRVRRARGPMDEARGEKTVGVDLEHAGVAPSCEGGVGLEEAHRGPHGGLLGVGNGFRGGVVAERPEHAHGLRRRERQREARHRALVLAEAASERGAVAWVLAVAEEALERGGVDGEIGSAEGLGACAEEDAGVLGAERVVVLATGRDLLGVVGPRRRRPLRRREAQHGLEAPETERPTKGAAVSTTRE